MIGVTIGCGTLLLFYLCVVDLAWVRVLCVPTFIAIGPLGTAIGLPLAIGMVIPEIVPNPEFLCRFPFYLWWAAFLGLSVNCGAHVLLNKNTSRSVLIGRLIQRLDAVKNSLRRFAAGQSIHPQNSEVFHFALEGVVEPLKLLALAGKLEPWLKKHQIELRAKFILVDRLLEAAALSEEQKDFVLDDSVKRRVIRVADACRHWRRAINETNWVEIPLSQSNNQNESSNIPPPLLEMERVVALMPLTFRHDDVPDELKLPPQNRKMGLLVPDAFTNPEYYKFAIKGALAGLICYLIFTSVKYEGIDTSITTCIVCSLATVGASVQKGLLRISEVAIGGSLGVLTLMFIFSHLDSLGGFWLPVAVVTGLAAYVNFGSPRISYCGYQINYAFFNCVPQTYGPYTELRVVRDRLIGILLGLTVFGVINRQLWPVKAIKKTEEKLASVLRLLAKLAILPDDNPNPAPQLTEAYGLRLQIYQELTVARQLLESSKFEPGQRRRDYLEKLKENLQLIFVRLLAVIQHRAELRPQNAPEPMREAFFRLRSGLSQLLQNLASRIEGKTFDAAPDLQGMLGDLRRTIDDQIGNVTDFQTANQIVARLALYSETISIAETIITNGPDW